ncbi:MAG: hypothetical protein AABX59_00540, partial [Nanoarchaeota archaeon]
TDITSAIASCTLAIDGKLADGDPYSLSSTDNTITEEVEQTFALNLGDGDYAWNVSCIDSSLNANKGVSQKWKFSVSTTSGQQGGSGGQALTDKGIDIGFYYKSDGAGIFTKDSQMVANINITLDILDDNVNTPSTTSVIRYRGGEKYESFVVEVREESSNYGIVHLYGRVRIIDTSPTPFNISVYAYQSNKDTPNTASVVTFLVNDVTNEKVKWVEWDISSLARLEDGFGWMRFRISATNLSTQDNDRLQFSELHVKVG